MARDNKPERDLPASSYVILGLLATGGPMTPYEMKKSIDGSIGYFWDFPRAQLYIDPERLAQRGLIAEVRETTGRRRRVYHITEAGRAEARRWLHDPTVTEVELRDTGLLKLYFSAQLSPEDVVELARRERNLHQRRLATYLQIQTQLEHDPATAFALATLRMGVTYEQISIAFWEDIAKSPPSAPAATPPVQSNATR